MKRAANAFLIALGICGLLATTPAEAARKIKSPTEITATFTDKEPDLLLGLIPIGGTDDPDTFSGSITSDRSVCLGKRTIAIYRSGAANSFTHTTTADDGTWTINKEDPPAGTYFAFAERRETRRRGRTVVCLAARSENMTVS